MNHVRTARTTKFFIILGLLAFLSITVFFTSCRGGLCSAIDDGLNDADSDCTADTSDNCPLDYNPMQYDGDTDGAGWECDIDDTDSTVAMSLIKDPAQIIGETNSSSFASTVSSLVRPTPSGTLDLDREDGFYFLLSCEGNFLGLINGDSSDDLSLSNPKSDFGSTSSLFSVLNSSGVYGRHFTNCSAFNNEAANPPKIYFRLAGASNDEFVGYLSTNKLLDQKVEPCLLFGQLGIEADLCE